MVKERNKKRRRVNSPWSVFIWWTQLENNYSSLCVEGQKIECIPLDTTLISYILQTCSAIYGWKFNCLVVVTFFAVGLVCLLQVNNLKEQLFEKLEQFLVDLHLDYKEIRYASSGLGGIPVSASSTAHEVCQSNIVNMLGNCMLSVYAQCGLNF